MGNYGCLLANALSTALDFHGPSVTLDTACSGALTAVNMVSRRLLLQWLGAAQDKPGGAVSAAASTRCTARRSAG
jgi:hypothetical protein